MNSVTDITICDGFLHSEIHGSKYIRNSPWLIAAYYVLHRLHAPRHPLDALKALDRSHYQCPQPERLAASARRTLMVRSKNQNSRAVAVSPQGYRVKQAAKHLFTMSKDPAGPPTWGLTCQTCLFDATSRRCAMVEPIGIEPTT